MRFIKNFLLNILLIAAGALIAYLIYPDIFGIVYKVVGDFFIPILIASIAIGSIPKRRRTQKY